MWKYDKKLQYPVNIKNSNPAMAKIIMTQLGGPDGETGASMRYLHQRYSCPFGEITGILTDVGTDASKWRAYPDRAKPQARLSRALIAPALQFFHTPLALSQRQ